MRSKSRFALLLAAVAFAASVPARASLGGDTASVRDDQAKLQGALQTTTNGTYTVHEIQAASGIVVREYVSPSGAVFAVTWHGPRHPDLRQVLGAYFDPFTQAVQAQRAVRHGLGPRVIQQAGFTVVLSGHMGALSGTAYLPQSFPAGIRAEEIR
ncbi:MAG TPA: DUF2844 domain-containing protein [Verrucomicrobiae bacterium]|jgi:hypothetical protein|nr:DUF2844 domain-containing protein [Verrucomicrobiae bacterium]